MPPLFAKNIVVVDQFTPMYQFTPTPKFIQNRQFHNKLHMYMIKLIIIYDGVNIFSMKKYESLRKLRVGMNRYTGVNWSTTTSAFPVNLTPLSRNNFVLWAEPLYIIFQGGGSP